MADVAATFGTLLAMGIAFPGLLITLWLLFPQTVERAKTRLTQNPLRCFWVGLLATALVGTPALALLNLPGFGQFSGSMLIILALTFSAIGAAGLAARLGERFEANGRTRISGARAFLCAAIALELAAIFPVLGWFVIMPLLIVMAFGASILALSRRRRKVDLPETPPETTAAPPALQQA